MWKWFRQVGIVNNIKKTMEGKLYVDEYWIGSGVCVNVHRFVLTCLLIKLIILNTYQNTTFFPRK